MAWAEERSRRQNPRIRGLLVAAHRLESVLHSSYIVLHCSPAELAHMATRVREVLTMLRDEVLPALRASSAVAALEAARLATLEAFRDAERQVSEVLDALAAGGASDPEGLEARQALSRVAGLLYGFVLDSYGRLMAADPRSRHGADYFLSRQFAVHVRESGALFVAVLRFEKWLRESEPAGRGAVSRVATRLARTGELPLGEPWEEVAEFLEHLLEAVVPRLSALLVMDGIRFAEARQLDRLRRDLEIDSRLIQTVHGMGSAADETWPSDDPAAAAAKTPWTDIVADRLGRHLRRLEGHYASLEAFLPAWSDGIQGRRALAVAPDGDEAREPGG